jgi:hypothetical protein
MAAAAAVEATLSPLVTRTAALVNWAAAAIDVDGGFPVLGWALEGDRTMGVAAALAAAPYCATEVSLKPPEVAGEAVALGAGCYGAYVMTVTMGVGQMVSKTGEDGRMGVTMGCT